MDVGIEIFSFSIDQEEQKRRLEERVYNPLKQWKLSSVDVKAQGKWQNFTKYKEAMFKNTSTKKSPWVVIDGNHREIARKEAMRYVLNEIDYSKKGTTNIRLVPNPSILKRKLS